MSKATTPLVPSEDQELIEACLREVHLGHYQEVSQQIRELPRREMHTIVRLLLAIENESPLGDSMAADIKANLAVTRIVGALLQDCDDNTASALLEAGYTFRDESPARATYHLIQIAEAFSGKADYANLAGAYLWMALVDSDRRDFTACIRHVWQALACCHFILRSAQSESVEWRKAVRWLAAAQHQLGIVCRLSKDFKRALLYYHRSLTVAQRVNDWRRIWASEGSIANVFRDQDYVDRSLLHSLRSLVACLRGHESPEMAPIALSSCYQSIGKDYANEGHHEAAVRLYRRSYAAGIARRDLLPEICAALCQLKRYSEAETYFEELLAAPLPLGVEQRYNVFMTMVSISRHLDRGRESLQLIEDLVNWLVHDDVIRLVEDEQARQALARRLEATPSSEHDKRTVLLFALGRIEEAAREIGAGLAAAPAASKPFWQRLADQVDATGGRKKAAAPSIHENASTVCAACKRPMSPTSITAGALCGSCQEVLSLENMVLVPAGMASMPDGSTVPVPTFYIDKTPVTNRLFKLHHSAEQLSWRPAGWDHALRCLDGQPVVHVSRIDCEAFCQWRSKVAGRTFRLPTVAQWMRAALGDDGRRYPWGDTPPNHEQAAYALCEDEHAVPPPVGTFPAGASPFGVLDMAGTVFEWTSSTRDDGQPYHLGGACGCEEKYLNPRYLMSMDLTPATPDSRDYGDLGFRCVTECCETELADSNAGANMNL